MLFTDSIFLFYFLPFVLLAHRLAVSKSKKGSPYPFAGRLFIFSATLVFYGFEEPWWLVPFLICVGFDFIWAWALSRSEKIWTRRLWLSLSVIQNLSLLGLFKYSAFFTRIAVKFFPTLDGSIPTFSYNEGALLLPAGISFYTFESLSFVIDVYRRDILPPKSPLEFLSFMGMFPRFVAGPIVRYRDLVGQMHSYSGMKLEAGLRTFVLGLFLKICFADQFALFTAYAFDQPARMDIISAWLGTLAYSFQIYFDFSGYSLMAIGLGRALGFEFPPNFNRPYHSTSITDFWRRWHMSLSFWLRDYVYISLGGNRKGKLRTYFNLLATMAIGGLWHGANYTFVLWGFWHGAWLCIEKAFGQNWVRNKTFNVLSSFLIVHLGWVLFKANHLYQVKQILLSMIGLQSEVVFNPTLLQANPFSVGLCLAGLFYVFIFERNETWAPQSSVTILSLRKLAYSLAMAATAILTIFSAGRTIPFLYFQF